MKDFTVLDMGYKYQTLTFGKPIALTVLPTDESAVRPAVSILRAGPGSASDAPQVCLAAGFYPNLGHMVLTLNNYSLLSVKTTNSVLSAVTKRYFFTGYSKDNITSCHFNGTDTEESTATSPAPVTTNKPESIPLVTMEIGPMKLNFYLLLTDAVRLVFIKTLVFTTMFTITALI